MGTQDNRIQHEICQPWNAGKVLCHKLFRAGYENREHREGA